MPYIVIDDRYCYVLCVPCLFFKACTFKSYLCSFFLAQQRTIELISRGAIKEQLFLCTKYIYSIYLAGLSFTKRLVRDSLVTDLEHHEKVPAIRSRLMHLHQRFHNKATWPVASSAGKGKKKQIDKRKIYRTNLNRVQLDSPGSLHRRALE